MKSSARKSWKSKVAAAVMLLLGVAWAGWYPARAEKVGPVASSVDFVRDVQPILSAHCYACHDGAKHKGGLRLDLKSGALAGSDSGKVITPGDPQHSRLIELIRGDKPDQIMPAKGERLTAKQIDTLTRWISAGAAWPDGIDPKDTITHWSFRKPVRPALPLVKQGGWVRNPIDAFILAGLEQAGLSPSPEADRYALIRRLSLDLVGLPPTPQEVDAFVTDTQPDAYEKLVERLQANPHYGERWARMWLDLARYADSAGYGSDPLRNTCFRYRDWLIDAFNRNLPFDQFTIEQLAGDLLPNPTTEQLIATAFHRNTMTNTEGGTDPEEWRNAQVKDRTENTLQVWMGLTMGCAQCHTHKYDPITNREYYQLFAVFNQTEDANRADEAPTIATPSHDQEAKIERLKTQVAELETKMSDPAHLAAALATWEKEQKDPQHHATWVELEPQSATSAGGATLSRLPDRSILASGHRSDTDIYTVTVNTDLRNITAFRLEALPDPSLPANGPGRAMNGNFVLNDFRVSIAPAQKKPVRGRFVRIDLPGSEKILALAEVQVFSGGENIAPAGKASQSSIAFDGAANLAIDNNTNGVFEGKSVSHTDKQESPWWEVDLGKSADISRLAIWNRTDSDLQSRLDGARVSILDEKRATLWESTIATAPQISLELDPAGPSPVVLNEGTATFEQSVDGDWSAARAIDADLGPASGWSIAPQTGHAHIAAFQTQKDVGFEGGNTLVFTLVQTHPGSSLGRFRISATTQPRPVRMLPSQVAEVLNLPLEQRSDAQKATLLAYFKPIAPDLKTDREQADALKKELASIKPVMTAVMRELPPGKRRPNHVLVKGNFLNRGDLVTPDVPAAFGPLPKDAPHDRLGVAQWLVHPDNPLTARVAVNRFWAQLFGTGIVETQEDFGTQGAPPVNQPLLDWMATEFIARHWDMKDLVRTIVTSAAYRQSSRTTSEQLAKDPHNRLISRGPRNRLEAEMVRDQALSLAGLLSPKMYGPSVFPPQPPGLWQAAFNGERTYPTSTGEDTHRRGVYTFWRRTVPYPSMAAFDAPSRENCTLRRIHTNTPLQAFVTLNDPVYVECAQSLARRLVKEGGETPEQRAKYGLRLCLARMPDEDRAARLLNLYNEELARYRDDKPAALKLATDPRGPLPDGADPSEMAAWTTVANVLLNMDGVMVK